MTYRSVLAVPLAVVALVLSGCTGDAEEPSEPVVTSGAEVQSDSGADGEQDDPGMASVADQVMAEQAIDTPQGSGDARGGEVTVTLRSVQVGDGTMTVRWALRWDDDEAPADAGASYYDMGVAPIMTVTDRAGLKAYRPFCTDGAWQSDEGAVADGVALSACQNSMLVSPLERVMFRFPNHGTVEAWAVLPAPEGEPEVVDVAPGEGLPMFTDATVTYLGGEQE